MTLNLITNYKLQLDIRLFLYLQSIVQQIKYSDSHHGYCTALSYGITCQSHCQRKNSSTKKSHYHQTGNYAKLQKFSGDEFDIGNADADDLYDLVDDITDELSDFDYLIDLF